MKNNYRVCATIDLEKIKNNLTQMKKHIGENKKIMAVVKADAYGHGAVPVATYLENLDFLWGFGVATIGEAVELRSAGIKKDILVFGCVFPEDYEDLITYDIIATIYAFETAKALSGLAQKENHTLRAHIKVDTGMGRLGFLPTKENVCLVSEIMEMPNLNIEGVFTHYAKADEKDLGFTYMQHQKSLEFFNALKTTTDNDHGEKAKDLTYFHCSNSAGIISYPDSDCHIVRAGISMYGHYPSEEVPKDKVVLEPALKLTSHVSFVKEVPKGTPISYGGTFVTSKTTKIATIPVGYGDGYPRSLSNIGYVLIGGKRCKILGRVCMDQFMVDVSHLPDVKIMDLVVLVGKMDNEEIIVEELSDLSGRFNYEFLCCLGKRIPRKYDNH